MVLCAVSAEISGLKLCQCHSDGKNIGGSPGASSGFFVVDRW